MSDHPPGPRNLEFTAAFLLLRIFLGLRALLAGLDKFEGKGTYSTANYQENVTRMAQGITSASFLPLGMTRSFAFGLGYLLIAVGIALLFGLKTRLALIAMGILYLGLSFGLMAVQENEGVAFLAVHLALVVGALLLVRHDRFALWPAKSA